MVSEFSVGHFDFSFGSLAAQMNLACMVHIHGGSHVLRRSFVKQSLSRDLLGCSWHDNLVTGALCYQVTSADSLTPSSRVSFSCDMINAE